MGGGVSSPKAVGGLFNVSLLRVVLTCNWQGCLQGISQRVHTGVSDHVFFFLSCIRLALTKSKEEYFPCG